MSFRKASVFFVLVLSFFALSCTKAETPQSEYGNDADYYMALRARNADDTDTAKRLFAQAAKKGSPVVMRRAREELAKLGTVGERIQTLQQLYRTYPDEDSLLLLCRELDSAGEYADILSLTNKTDVSSCANELAYYRCLALLRKNDSRFSATFLDWCTSRPFTEHHYALYAQVEAAVPLVQLRALVYEKKYDSAYPLARGLLADPASVAPQTASDIGKSFLYGSTRYSENASLLDSAADSSLADSTFYMHFYAGRLYDKAGASAVRVKDRYEKAMQSARTDSLFDNACWYYLSAALKSSAKEAVEEVAAYRTQWHDPYYYDDFFDTLSLRLISEHLWTDYYRVATLIDGYASDESVAKFSYMSARLIQSGYIQFDEPSEPIVLVLLIRALSSGSDFYYRILAACALNLTRKEQESVILSYGTKTEYNADPDCERLMNGYADFGLAENIYAEWQRFDRQIGTECVVRLAGFLKDCADNAGGSLDRYYEQSIRMASRRANYPDAALTRELLSLAFPRDFSAYVSESCSRFELAEYLLYALIRSESFFAPAVTSHANATGLTQIMDATAGDIARKLRMTDYNLEDPETNILFGAYYLWELQSRRKDALIHAFFSYNGGYSRVTSWLKSAELEFGTKELSNDIFLEALPFAETREYGRKITAAASVYGWLYYDSDIRDITATLMQKPAP